MEMNANTNPNRRAAVNGLAVVGFVALVFIGMTLAISAARYVPEAVSRVASASVYFSSMFTDDKGTTLEVVTPSTNNSAATATTTATSTTTTSTGTKNPTPTAGPSTSGTYVVGGGSVTTAPATLYGLSDLALHITAVGYLSSGSDTNTFVASKSIPDGKRGAAQFTVTNVGTNLSGSFKFDAELPTSPSYTFSSPSQQSLNPGEHIDFTIGFDRPRAGSDRIVEITVDPGHKIVESNEKNNEDSITVNIK